LYSAENVCQRFPSQRDPSGRRDARPTEVIRAGLWQENLLARMLSLCSCVVADFGADASFSIGARSMRRRGRVGIETEAKVEITNCPVSDE